MLDHGAGIAISLNNDGADDLAVEIQRVSWQRFLRRNVEELHKTIVLLADLQFHLLRLYAHLSRIYRTQAIDAAEHGNIRFEVFRDQDIHGVYADIKKSFDGFRLVCAFERRD